MENFNQCWEWEKGPLQEMVVSLLDHRFPPETALRRAPPYSDHRPDAEGTFQSQSVYHETHSDIIWLGEVMYAPVNQSMTGRRGHEVPAWASIAFDAECWYGILTDLRIDNAAIENFYKFAKSCLKYC